MNKREKIRTSLNDLHPGLFNAAAKVVAQLRDHFPVLMTPAQLQAIKGSPAFVMAERNAALLQDLFRGCGYAGFAAEPLAQTTKRVSEFNAADPLKGLNQATDIYPSINVFNPATKHSAVLQLVGDLKDFMSRVSNPELVVLRRALSTIADNTPVDSLEFGESLSAARNDFMRAQENRKPGIDAAFKAKTACYRPEEDPQIVKKQLNNLQRTLIR